MRYWVYKLIAATGLSLISCSLLALEVNITKDMESVETTYQGNVVNIQRIQDQDNVLTGGFAKTSRKCPPFCIQPVHVAPGVTTAGELEVLEFIKNKVNKSTGVLIDARTPSWHESGTIPGSVNIPFTTFDEKTPELVKNTALAKLGVRKKGKASFLTSAWQSIEGLLGMDTPTSRSKYNFDNAKDIMLWCNGMWCGQSPRAIKGLLELGYPPEKIYYYRGGMQSWKVLGLTVVEPRK